MNRQILDFVPHNEYLDVPNLMKKLLDEGLPPKIFLHKGKWLDIGRKEDYEKVVDEFESNIEHFLPDGKK